MYLPQLRAKALADGVSRSTVDRVFPTLQFSSRTVELDRGQPGGTAGSPAIPPFAPYRARHVTPSLVSRGEARYAGHLGRPHAIGRRYCVEPTGLVPLWGPATRSDARRFGEEGVRTWGSLGG